MKDELLTYEVVEQLAACIEEASIALPLFYDKPVPVALIGAQAMAVHGYVRATADFDLGICAPEDEVLFDKVKSLFTHRAVQSMTRHTASLDDPLGGVWRLDGDEIIPVEVVNFYAPHQRQSPGGLPLRNGIYVEGLRVKVVDLEYLILLKLYAGSRKDERDIVELIELNHHFNKSRMLELVSRFGYLDRFNKILGQVDIG